MKHNGFEYVNLGLPSGTRWARCNVGANSETSNGLYFQCGGTVAFSHLLYENDFDSHILKYNGGEKTTLHLDNDAAHIHMGGKWHMPSRAQFDELLDNKNTISMWVSDYCHSGVSGRLFRSRVNNETLFIPANGFINGYARYQNGASCLLWTSSLDFSSVYTYSYFTSEEFYANTTTICSYYVCMGVRGVFNTFWVK